MDILAIRPSPYDCQIIDPGDLGVSSANPQHDGGSGLSSNDLRRLERVYARKQYLECAPIVTSLPMKGSLFLREGA